MEKTMRRVLFIIPAVPSAAGRASEMAVDFLSKSDWLADDLSSLLNETRKSVAHMISRSIRLGCKSVLMRVDVFPQDCVIRISHRGTSAKQVVIHLSQTLQKISGEEGEVMDTQDSDIETVAAAG